MIRSLLNFNMLGMLCWRSILLLVRRVILLSSLGKQLLEIVELTLKDLVFSP